MNADEKILVNELVKKVKDKDEDALEELYRIMYKVLFCFLRKFCADDEIIKDTINNTFIKIIEKVRDKMYFKNCYGWVLSIAKFEMLNANRKNKKEFPITDEVFQIEDKCKIDKAKELDIKKALNELNLRDKRLLYLRCYEEYTFNQIAKEMKMSVITAKRQFYRIRDYIKDKTNYEE